MKLLLLLFVSCLALHNGRGAPTFAVYKFLKCNPNGDQANCVPHKSPEMEWSPDLPSKLPAATAQDLEAEPVEDEKPPKDEEAEEQLDGEDMPMLAEEGESPPFYYPEEGSGIYEGSAYDGPFIMGRALAAESETGSAEFWNEKEVLPYKGEYVGERRSRNSRSVSAGARPAEQELREDNLLQL